MASRDCRGVGVLENPRCVLTASDFQPWLGFGTQVTSLKGSLFGVEKEKNVQKSECPFGRTPIT